MSEFTKNFNLIFFFNLEIKIPCQSEMSMSLRYKMLLFDTPRVGSSRVLYVFSKN